MDEERDRLAIHRTVDRRPSPVEAVMFGAIVEFFDPYPYGWCHQKCANSFMAAERKGQACFGSVNW